MLDGSRLVLESKTDFLTVSCAVGLDLLTKR
jgi:hypothetical protein